MTVSVKKWGNSLALRIPKDVAQSLQIENESLLELHIKDGVMIVEPARDTLLESLVSGITSENLHAEIDSGEATGHEEW